MGDDLSLFVRPGDKLTASLWNKLVALVRSCRVWPGTGTRIRRTPDGCIISASFADSWDHPFKVFFGGDSCTINKGLVDSIEPTINGVPLSGDAKKKKDVPTLNLGSPKFDKDGLGWIVVEITVDSDKWKTVSAEIKQVDTLKADSKLKGRHPIALLTQRDNGSIDCFQVEYFNLQHRTDGKDKTPTRHFFWPA